MDDRRLSAGASRPLSADERASLGGWLRDVGPRLHAYVLRAYPRGVDADDIVAEVFVRAARNIEALRRAPRPDLYLLVAARNLCRDEHRRFRPATLSAASIYEVQSAELDPAVRSLEHEGRDQLLAAVEALPDVFREVVVLRLATGLTFEEIAELVGAPLGTVLSRMHQAVDRLRRNLRSDRETVLGK